MIINKYIVFRVNCQLGKWCRVSVFAL